jgi:EAL domain-containing protein (putative c-di-GMP-specific phosphodiesterase class I)
MAVRPPTAGPASAASAASEPATAESLGWQLRAALPPLRLHSVSLYDKDGNVLWLSEGALGPDEHSLVLEAMEALASDTTQTCHENGMEDGRVAICLPVRTPKGDLVGLSMILADLKSVGDGVLERLVTPQIRTIMQKIAVLLRGTVSKTSETGIVPVLDISSEANLSLIPDTARHVVPPPPAAAPAAGSKAAPARVAPVAAVAPAAAPAPAKPAAARAKTAPVAAAPAAAKVATGDPLLTPEAIDDILEFELTPDLPPVDIHKSAPTRAPVRETASEANGVAGAHGVAGEAAQVTTPNVPTLSAASEMADSIQATASLGSASASVAAPVSAPTATVSAPPTVGTAPRVAPSAAAASPATAHAVPATASPSTSATTNSSKTLPSSGSTTTSRMLSSNDSSHLLLEVQPYAKLRAGGRSRRFELQVRTPNNRDTSRDSAALDAHALQRLLSWLSANRGSWNLEPTSFTLNLSITTLEDERFPQNVASALKSHGIAPDTIGFEIAEPLCMQRRAQVERFITLCDKIGCFIVIDDFSLDSAVLPLLRSKALRLVKIDPKLTGVALKDKLSQALVVAIAQAVRVLGIHCSAKRVDSQGSLQWLTAIGCDFAQGSAVSQLQPLEALLSAAPELAKV